MPAGLSQITQSNFDHARKGFFGIMQRWGVDNETARRMLGSPPERTFFAWKRGSVGRVPEDTDRKSVV